MMGQNGANPFELQHRADKKAKVAGSDSDIIEEPTEADVANENPFNVIRIPEKTKSSVSKPKLEAKPKNKITDETAPDDKNFRFSLTLAMLVFLAVSLSIYRTQLIRAYHAFTNENVLRMLHREKGTVAYVPYYVLYSLFLFNLGVYIYLLLRYYNLTPGVSNISLLMMTIGTAIGLFLSLIHI